MTTIQAIMQEANATAHEKGWYDASRTSVEELCLMHSELSEALEEVRAGKGLGFIYEANGKPEGVPVELADLIIRVCDACQEHGIDLEAAITQKLAYNRTRPYRHGGKRL